MVDAATASDRRALLVAARVAPLDRSASPSSRRRLHVVDATSSRQRGDLSRRCRAAALVAALALLSVAAACSDDDGADAQSSSTTASSSSSTSSTAEPTTTTTQPPSTDLAAVEPLIAALLGRNAEAVARLRSDPTLAEDENADAVVAYRDLYTRDSPQADAYLDTIRQVAAGGTADRAGPSGSLEEATLIELLPGEIPDPDVVFFQFCGFTDFETYVVSTGEVQARQAIKTIGGGEARRIGGVWLLHDFQVPDENLVSELPSGTENPCELEQ